MVDAALSIANYKEDKSFYVWSGTRYARCQYHGQGEEITSGPYDTRSNWSSFKSAGWGAVDAVIPSPSVQNTFYVFHGAHYMRVSIDPENDIKDSITYGPTTTASQWKGLVGAGFETVDAGVPDPIDNDNLFFFSGTKTLKLKVSQDKVIWGPMPIAEGWPSIKKAGFDTIDAIFKMHEDDIFYVFCGDQYATLKWDGTTWATLASGPKLIKDDWKSLKEWV
ncbi:unnamed protein product [Penicillium nalgiovense]|uniref:Hemopexin n=1 Tax=Penicillium nalgiovense TaxID=60175 RepID=A0A1V6Z417_PENNA|nr:hypothetical protein PENNAL_c0004G03744 [Penicillium nalgiovense]CAG7946006.1 unnamed protein product [Penicillium nalgiovense]CAG7949032.1 unnamed protein product [Penicillium nalgiovense]CAG7965971.1 unnamed protein product [Penicillium nalgiovense]CAG8038160.1 unnamed protein product [Penicillium nalgiovense]